MSLLHETPAVDSPGLSPTKNLRLVAAAPALWRVLDRSGRVIGHLQAVVQGHDIRYRARRFHAPSRTFRDIGEFWSADDALDCLRLVR
jgi:hypothetical protein